MGWFDKIKEKLTGKVAAASTSGAGTAPEGAAVTAAAVAAGAAGMPDLKELEKKGMLGQFFRYWKNPAFLTQVKAVASRMQAEGVNIKDQKAVMEWMQKHGKDLQSGQLGAAGPDGKAPPKQVTVVKTGPDVGRNDPCPCGSGKKFKKCCESKTA